MCVPYLEAWTQGHRLACTLSLSAAGLGKLAGLKGEGAGQAGVVIRKYNFQPEGNTQGPSSLALLSFLFKDKKKKVLYFFNASMTNTKTFFI